MIELISKKKGDIYYETIRRTEQKLYIWRMA